MKPKKIPHPGEIIARQMKEAKINIPDLAFLIGKSYQIVYAVLRYSRPISLDFAQRCALIFGVTPQFYLNAKAEYNLSLSPLKSTVENEIKNRYFKEFPALKAKKSIYKKRCGRKWVRENH